MEARLEQIARDALRCIDEVLNEGPRVEHDKIRAAALAVIALRNHAIDLHREGKLSRSTLDRTNALASLTYGAEFPLSGLHLKRLAQTREGVAALLDDT